MSEVRLTEEESIELENNLKTLRELRKDNIIFPEEYKIELKNKYKADLIKIYEYIDKEENTFEAYKEKHGAGRSDYAVYKEWYSKPFPPEIQALIDKNGEDLREYLEEKYPEVDCSTIDDLNSEWFEWYNFLYGKLGMAWLRGE
ncbi:hypothetical protein DB313_05270 (plasmid) [Borrelia turcica IST7]|uniref:Uncharacterized protein n=1 Tax=Borrelia turcica IST7 TaxID=1104446 RepID=A0A386PN07_9SPIR|nr:hypothetical protein [Borrelia turcica]AYE36911.1 hypothetical protein DB313_05270 [Borrelia turcica IST7]